MGRFLDRYLPPLERRTALWLALGGAGVSVAATQVGAMARRSAMAASVTAGGTSEWSPALVVAIVQFALVAVLVALVVRFAGAPKALALYVVLGSALSAAILVLGMPFDYVTTKMSAAADPHLAEHVSEWWIPAAKGMLEDAAVGIGALAGAWIAATVSLARIRDEGFSGDDPDGEGLRAKPAPMGWSFLGWAGRPIVGDALVAVEFVDVRVIPGVVGVVASGLASLVTRRVSEGNAASAAWALTLGVLALAWFVSARLVTKRSGVASLWVVPFAGLLQSAVFAAQYALTGVVAGNEFPLLVLQGVIAPLLLLVATLSGTELALRTRPATLADTPESQQPDAEDSASDDTAGG